MSDQAAMAGGGGRHVAWFYATVGEYFSAIEEFIRVEVALRRPVLVAVPQRRLPPDWAASLPAGVTVVDMAEIGRNPARIMPFLRAFADRHGGWPISYLAEPVWRGRTAAELREAARHEALLNIAFPAADIAVRCLYNTADLPRSVLSDACRTHPFVHSDGTEQASQDYREAPDWPAGFSGPLAAPPGASALAYGRDLRPVRTFVAAIAGRAGLPAARCTDLVIAANEVAANTLKHTSGGGVVRAWMTDDEVLCQIEDAGYIADPLAGQSRPAPDGPGRRGLWLVNQVCDLAEIRTNWLGTTVRLHMYLASRRAAI